MTKTKRPFRLGRVVTTPNARVTIPPEELKNAIARHAACDWGDCTEEFRDENEFSLQTGREVRSLYVATSGAKFFIITEADRSMTTVLLVEEWSYDDLPDDD